ncbi:MAG: RNA ligase [Polyangiales bacterium]
MRTLLYTRGPQGAGKSTFLRQAGLIDYTISADNIRVLVGSPVLGMQGQRTLPQMYDARVWGMLFDLLEERMARGELICVDGTHRSKSDTTRYLELASKYRYRVLCADFSETPLETCLERNLRRDETRVVPEATVRDTHAACLRGEHPAGVTRIGAADDAALGELAALLRVPTSDLSRYAQVLHIGDLQGCHAPLKALIPEWRDDTFYVFVGDYCDRGPENAEVLRELMPLTARENFAFMWGNHEDALHRFARGLPPIDDEFAERTGPQLTAAGITPKEVDAFCDSLVDVFQYTWHQTKVLVSHAGMSTVPERPELISSSQWSRGTGGYSEDIGAAFDEHAPEGWFQVHGHRNFHERPVAESARSFNLEEHVENGGHLRALRLDDAGFHPLRVRNDKIWPAKERLAFGILRDTHRIYPAWTGETDAIDAELLASLKAHDLVHERESQSQPHISAFNFSRDAFFDKKWDDMTVRARGLFVDTEHERIVARSYEKFFNLGERPETQDGALRANFQYPIDVWLKENGYLGIIGYDAHTKQLVFASKSSLESDFAGWLRELAKATFGEAGLERLRRYLRDSCTTAIFEVIDPVRDPHIIEYDAPRLVLLDLIRRHEDFQCVDYDQLVRAARYLSLGDKPVPVKERIAQIKDWDAFQGFRRAADAPEWRYRGQPLEGFVYEDAAGFFVKQKLDYYAFWKYMRGLALRVRKTRGTTKALGRDISEPRVAAFHAWLVRQADAVLSEDIISLRRRYLAGHEEPSTKPITSKRDEAELRGYCAALENLASRGGEIQSATAGALLERALADDRMMDALRTSPLRIPLVLAADVGDTRRDAADRLNVDVD